MSRPAYSGPPRCEAERLARQLWAQFYDRQPPGDPKDTWRALLVEIERMRVGDAPQCHAPR